MATAIIGTLKHLPKASILPTLPETGRPNRIYFIPNEDPTEDNRYNEYLWVKDETYPDGHWELVGPTTIDLTDYATKEEVSDLKDSIGEQIKKYLPLSGGTMDKGSNISFPLDSGSTVYNGSGISVGGKASTDILHAAGGTTKIKTLNGESMLGEGNIVIDPSSVPVSLSWYNRTSSQQDATINLTIGDTTVNLFPNIFKLFKAGKVSTSESLSIELTANPGVSVVYSNLNKQAADKLEKELIHKYNSIEEGYNLKEGGSRGELSTKSLAKMSESLKRGYSEFPERREKIRNKALGRKMPKDTRCKISLNHSKSNLLKINDEVGSIRYWALKIGKAHSVLSYRLKVHGIDNLRKYIEQRIKLV